MSTTPDSLSQVEEEKDESMSVEVRRRQNPILQASWFSKLFFMFVSSIIHLARSRSLTPDDIWELDEEYGSHRVGDKIMEHWDFLKITQPERAAYLNLFIPLSPSPSQPSSFSSLIPLTPYPSSLNITRSPFSSFMSFL
jgi:hypothetical protein